MFNDLRTINIILIVRSCLKTDSEGLAASLLLPPAVSTSPLSHRHLWRGATSYCGSALPRQNGIGGPDWQVCIMLLLLVLWSWLIIVCCNHIILDYGMQFNDSCAQTCMSSQVRLFALWIAGRSATLLQSWRNNQGKGLLYIYPHIAFVYHIRLISSFYWLQYSVEKYSIVCYSI